MSRNRPGSKSKRRRAEALKIRGPHQPRKRAGESPPVNLHQVEQESLLQMRPGDILLLDDAETLRSAVDVTFCAVLACPLCGTPGLITSPQYFGTTPVICCSELCSGRFRIDNESRLTCLPAN